jgi:hypothetical protein
LQAFGCAVGLWGLANVLQCALALVALPFLSMKHNSYISQLVFQDISCVVKYTQDYLCCLALYSIPVFPANYIFPAYKSSVVDKWL